MTNHADSQLESDKMPAPTWVEDVKTGDEPLGVMNEFHSYSPEFVAATEKRLLTRIDRRILPLVVLIYLFNYLDRNSITQARSACSAHNLPQIWDKRIKVLVL